MKYWACLLLVTPLLAEDPRVIAGSRWSINNDQKSLVPGKPVPAGGKITGPVESDLILDCGTEGWLAYHCKNRNGCTVTACGGPGPDVERRRVDPYGWPERKPSLGDMVSSLFRHQPKPAQTLGVRAAGNLTDAVVKQVGDKVLWAPALARVLEGNYCFQVGVLPAGTAKPRSFVLQWNREGDAGVELRNLPAGLYTLERGTPAGNGGCEIDDPDAAKAWVLVVSESDFERVRKEWESYTPGLKQLAESAGPEVASTVGHAVLAALADSAGK